MHQLNSEEVIRRSYVHAIEQELYATGVEYATTVEYVTDRQMFLIHDFNRKAAEWIVDVTGDWAEKFTATYNTEPIELFNDDIVSNEADAVYVTHNCAHRIYTLGTHKMF